jgi:hypothetical protein
MLIHSYVRFNSYEHIIKCIMCMPAMVIYTATVGCGS